MSEDSEDKKDPMDEGLLSSFQEKAVRDLAWLIFAQPLLTEATGLQLLAESQNSTQQTLAWLRQLDADPAAFLAELASQANVRRLGFYAAALTEYWLRHGPAWGTSSLLSSVPLTTSTGPNGKQLTAGQLKFVCRLEDSLLHVESSLKFFVDAIPVGAGLDTERPSLSRFVGPFLHENFAWRLEEAKRKLRCTQSTAVHAYLQEQLGELPVRSTYFLKGFIFRPLCDFRPAKPWSTPAELNGSCPLGWFTSSLEELSEKLSLSPGGGGGGGALPRVAVLPKLFWLGPAEARGDPPAIPGCGLSGQEVAIPVEPWDVVRKQVEEHFEKFENALLLCELVPVTLPTSEGDDTKEVVVWRERSRGFFLPPTWDPQALLTEGPTGRKSSSDGRVASKLEGECLDGFGDVRGRFSDRFADIPRSVPPDLRDVEIRCGPVQLPLESPLGRPLKAEDLAAFSMLEAGRSAEHPGAVADLQSQLDGTGWGSNKAARRVLLRAALRAAETALPGTACRLICSALLQLSAVGLKTAGHVVLELLWRESPVPVPDTDLLQQLDHAGVLGSQCARLVLRCLSRFGAQPLKVPVDAAADHLELALASGDRARAMALVEMLAAGGSLQRACDPEGDLTEPLGAPLAAAAELAAASPADVAALEQLCSCVPVLCSLIVERLTSTSQHRLARRFSLPALALGRRLQPSPEELPSADANLPPLSLPSAVRFQLVVDSAELGEVLQKAQAAGGVVAVDAEWRPFGRRWVSADSNDDAEGSTSPSAVSTTDASAPAVTDRLMHIQLLQLAWPDVVFVLDLPALLGQSTCREQLRLLFSRLSGQEPGGPLLAGYGLEGDLRRLADTCPEIVQGMGSYRGLELSRLESSAGSQSTARGLAGLCAQVLHRSLDKTWQRSDWALRPLRSAQLRYAALDAWILLPLTRRLLQTCNGNKGRHNHSSNRDDGSTGNGQASGNSNSNNAELSNSGYPDNSRDGTLKGCSGQVKSEGSASGLADLVAADAVISQDAAAAAAEGFEPLDRHGASEVLAQLRRLGATQQDARLVLASEAEEAVCSGRAVSCKTLACVLPEVREVVPAVGSTSTQHSLRCMLCVLPTGLEADLALMPASDGKAASLAVPAAQTPRLASADELRRHFGQPRGSVGPVGPAVALPGASLVLEESLLRSELLCCGGGAPGWHLLVRPGFLKSRLGALSGSFVTASGASPSSAADD
ncbi:unnamed protein product [Polarella glacialis]|uniref:3'-5' exonuclease domain-containing protein n=1 Tax=Polarella glacialis TaxID=89957 RepID=A0A813HUF5_POLGL|nr:unnamed protein product [Polarella glacialis]